MKIIFHEKYFDVYSGDPASAKGRLDTSYGLLKEEFEFRPVVSFGHISCDSSVSSSSRQISMIADCDLRIARLIQRQVKRELEEAGEVLVEILEIKHEGDEVKVLGVLEEPQKRKMKFATPIPRVDGPLDDFL
jgi:hypothetical protein